MNLDKLFDCLCKELEELKSRADMSDSGNLGAIVALQHVCLAVGKASMSQNSTPDVVLYTPQEERL